MNHQETAMLLTFMGEMYPNSRKPSAETGEMVVEVWRSMFEHVSFDIMQAAAQNHLRHSNFMPSVKEMTDEVAKITNPELYRRTHEDAFTNALESVWRFGYVRPEKAKEWLDRRDPLIWQTVQALGGFMALCKSDTGDTAIKAQFRDAYNAYKLRQQDDQQMSLSNLLTPTSPKQAIRAPLDDD